MSASSDPTFGPAFGPVFGPVFGPDSVHLVALESVLTRLEAIELRIRQAEAERMSLLAEAFDIAALESESEIASIPVGETAQLAYRAIRAEIAAALHQSEHTTERQMAHAVTLTQNYAQVFEAYRAGELSERHTTVIVEAGMLIGAGEAPSTVARRVTYETAVLEIALAETPTRLKPIARRLAEQCAEQQLDERHDSARRRRRVYVVDGEDGMADLIAHLPAAEAHGIHRRLTLMAAELARHEPTNGEATPAPRRCRDELRADILSDLLLGSRLTSAAPGGIHTETTARLSEIRPQVQIRLDCMHLPGVHPLDSQHPNAGPEAPKIPEAAADEEDEENTLFQTPAPPLLAGYGPIDTATARRLAGAATHWEMVRLEPESGTIHSVDRYRPSEQMRRLLRARDEHCRFPGCRVPAARCDLDHTIDAALGGPTHTENLAHLCRGHHTVKHHSGWSVKQQGDGVLDWASPSGRTYRERPRSRVRFTAADKDEPSRPDPYPTPR